MCHTQFAKATLSLNDGRDLFKEVVGEGGWSVEIGHKVYSIIKLIPEFIAEMYALETDFHVVGIFHLGQAYDMKQFADQEKK